MRGPARTGRLIVERARGLSSAPGVKPTGRQLQKAEDCSQRDTAARAIDGAQDAQLGFALG
jgi:hypothetical protein